MVICKLLLHQLRNKDQLLDLAFIKTKTFKPSTSVIEIREYEHKNIHCIETIRRLRRTKHVLTYDWSLWLATAVYIPIAIMSDWHKQQWNYIESVGMSVCVLNLFYHQQIILIHATFTSKADILQYRGAVLFLWFILILPIVD